MAEFTNIGEIILQLKDFENNRKGWYTPNTYDTDFKVPPNRPGVYLFLAYKWITNSVGQIVYIGSSKDLNKRYGNHAMHSKLQDEYVYSQFYFLETDDYLLIEKALIYAIKPKYNIQHNPSIKRKVIYTNG